MFLTPYSSWCGPSNNDKNRWFFCDRNNEETYYTSTRCGKRAQIKFRNEIKDQAVVRPVLLAREIYDKKVRESLPSENVDEFASMIPDLLCTKSTIQRVKARQRPLLPVSASNFILDEEIIKTHDDEKFILFQTSAYPKMWRLRQNECLRNYACVMMFLAAEHFVYHLLCLASYTLYM